MRRWLLILLLIGCAYGTSLAQNDGGQFWVRLYEDLDGNGVYDAGEPLLTSGAAVSLLNSEGVVTASALLDESPNAARGLIGFQYLPPGEYTVVITSPDYAATTEQQFTRTIVDTAPTVVEFGGRVMAAAAETARPARGPFGLPIYLGDPAQVARVALSLFGAMLVIGLMTVFGLLIFSLTVRRRQRAERRALIASQQQYQMFAPR